MPDEVAAPLLAVREQLARTEATDDAAWFGSPEGVSAVTALHRAAVGPDQTGSADAFLVLGAANLCRFLATGGEDEAALGGAVYFLFPIFLQAPKVVPEMLLPILGLLAGTATADPELAAAAASGLAAFHLIHRYPQVLPVAEKLMRYAVDQTVGNGPLHGFCQSSLAVVLYRLAAEEPARARALLAEAVELCRAAVASPAEEPGERARRLGNLGRMLITWASATGDADAAAEGADVTRRALGLVAEGTPYHTVMLANLGNAQSLLATSFGQPQALPDAIALLRRALPAMSPADPERAERQFSLGVCLAAAALPSDGKPDAAGYAAAVETIESAIAAAIAQADRLRFIATLAYLRFGWGSQTSDARSLELAESEARQILDTVDQTHPLHAQALFVASEVRMARFDLGGDPRDLDAAIAEARGAVELTPSDRQQWLGRVLGLCGNLRRKARETGAPAAAAEAAEIARQALPTTAPGSEDRAKVMFELAVALESGPTPGDDSLDLLRDCLELPAPDQRFAAKVRWELGRAYIRRAADDGDWDRGVARLHEAIGLLPPGDINRADYESTLAGTLLDRAKESGDDTRFAEALELARQAVADAATGTFQEAACRSNLGVALVQYGSHIGDAGLLEEGVNSHRAAVAVTRPGDFHRPLRMGNLADALRAMAELTSDTALLAQAIEVLREAVAEAPGEHPVRHQILSQLGTCLRARSEFDDDPAPLEEAARCLREAADLARAAGAPSFTARHALSNVLSDLTTFTRDESLRDEAVSILTDELASRPAGTGSPEERATLLNALGMNQWHQATERGDDTLHETAIATLTEATAQLPPRHVGRANLLLTLGAALLERADITGEPAWALEAAEVMRQALAACPERGAQRGGVLSNLSAALRQAYEATGDPALLEESAARAAEATALDYGQSGSRVYARLNLALAEYSQEVDGTDPRASARAIETLEAGLAEMRDDHPLRGRYLLNVAVFYWLRGVVSVGGTGLLTGDYTGTASAPGAGDDDVAVALRRGAEAAREALTHMPDGYAEQARAQAMLADIQLRRAQRGEHADLAEAARLARSAAWSEAAAADVRLRAARTYGEASAASGRDSDALEGYAHAVDLLGQVAPRGLARTAQEERLGLTFGLASDAAAMALRAGDPDRALALLEQGRGVLLSQQLDARSDLSRLRDLDPALAAEFERVRDALSADGLFLAGNDAIGAPGTASRATARHSLARQWDALVARVRELPGMAGFLRSPSVAELRAAAGSGPVVVINVSRYRSDAILVTSGGVQVVELPGLSPRAALTRALALGPLVERAYGVEGQDAIPAAVRALTQILEWLWGVIAAPVLDRLGLRYTPDDGEPWPRLYWCPTGWLSFLPLHAAGRRRAVGAQSVLDRVISSYTPTLGSLVRAREQLAEPSPGHGLTRPLVVSLPQTPGGAPLPGAAAEADVLARLFPGRTELAGRDATVEAVTAALPEFSVVHFGCHGVTEPGRPSDAGLRLYDGRLRALDAAALRLRRQELAVLAACATARGAVMLPDEAIHVTSAFHMAGYPHVIGTLWPVSDRFSAQLAERFYTALADDATLGHPADPAAALHFAIRELRDGFTAAPQLWAAHTHTGP